MSQTVEMSEVLTLEGAAAFLRVSEDAVLRLVAQQMLPARQIDGEWRFLRAALADWLRQRSGKAVLLSQVGALADDESLSDLRAAIYAQRGRPEAEES
jgi:excisionase family DNA binding protein